MKFKLTIAISLVVANFPLSAKSKGGIRMNISVPQFSSPDSNGVTYPVGLGLSPYFYNSPAYGNLILNQYNANVNAMNARIPQPQSDLGNQILDKHIQSEIAEEIRSQSIQSGNTMPIYRITNIIDHGRGENAKDLKFKNVDFLLWKYQSIEEGFSIQVNDSKLEFGVPQLLTDKPVSILKFINQEREKIFLLETRDKDVLTGFLVDTKTKKVNKIQCYKVKNDSREIYDYRILSEELDFWSYLALFNK